MKSFFSGSAFLVSALLLSFLLVSAQPSLAETLLSNFQKQAVQQANQQPASGGAVSIPTGRDGKLTGVTSEISEIAPKTGIRTSANPIAPKPAVENPNSEGVHYVATAYSLRGKTASGKYVSQGIIAADPRILPLGSRVRLEAGAWSGEYLVADTGGAIRGRKIDIWTPSSREAMRFGRRKVKLTVLSYPAKRVAKKRV
jgi:3D (Asp-Asp-Asp) domain-containing protein